MFVKRDQSKALEFISTMRQVTPVMGIGVRDPHMIELRDDRTETYLRSIRENLHPRVQMVVIIFPTSRDDRYAAVKKLCCVESPVPSQVCCLHVVSIMVESKMLNKRPCYMLNLLAETCVQQLARQVSQGCNMAEFCPETCLRQKIWLHN